MREKGVQDWQVQAVTPAGWIEVDCNSGDTRFVSAAPLYRSRLKAAIEAKVAELKEDGTVGMTVENMISVVSLPKETHGQPCGTNAAYYLKGMIREICAELKEFFI